MSTALEKQVANLARRVEALERHLGLEAAPETAEDAWTHSEEKGAVVYRRTRDHMNFEIRPNSVAQGFIVRVDDTDYVNRSTILAAKEWADEVSRDYLSRHASKGDPLATPDQEAGSRSPR